MRFPARAAAVVSAGLLTASALAAADTYWAFGDSITFAYEWDEVNSGVGGTCTPAPTYPTACGYQKRLQESLGKTVLNRGVSGEFTLDALSRIDNPGEPLAADRCADPEAGDVVVIMEGTNDVSDLGRSTAAAKVNLGAMVGLATSRCVHAVLGTIIRRIAASTVPDSTSPGDPNHPKTADMKNKIQELGVEHNRPVALVWDSICPNDACYDLLYTGKVAWGDPGHPRSAGFDLMEDIFHGVITAQAVAGAATGLAPSGQSIPSTQLTLVWDEWDVAGGFNTGYDWYFLEVTGPESHGRWYRENALCANGVCQLAPLGSDPTPGSYSWRVRTRNLRGVGQWTAAQPVTVLDCPVNFLTLENQTVSGPVTEKACATISAGNLGGGDYKIQAGADVVFDSGDSIALYGGFSIESEAEFEARVD